MFDTFLFFIFCGVISFLGPFFDCHSMAIAAGTVARTAAGTTAFTIKDVSSVLCCRVSSKFESRVIVFAIFIFGI